jgi:hypothetical protein
VIVAYLSPRAFLELVSKPEYATLNDLRVGALAREKHRCIATRRVRIRECPDSTSTFAIPALMNCTPANR